MEGGREEGGEGAPSTPYAAFEVRGREGGREGGRARMKRGLEEGVCLFSSHDSHLFLPPSPPPLLPPSPPTPPPPPPIPPPSPPPSLPPSLRAPLTN